MRRRKTLVFSLLSILMIYSIRALFGHIDTTSEKFTNFDSCPACFGDDLCPQFYHHDISLTGLSRLKYLRSSKNVFAGKLRSERVMLKKLAHDSEIEYIDGYICQTVSLPKSCMVNEAMKLLVKKSINRSNHESIIKVIKSSKSRTDISQCPTERLLSYILKKMHVSKQNVHDSIGIDSYKYGVMMYSSLLNPEAIILQAFPQAEGYPFPKYHGACGRVIVEENGGRTLSHFERSPWKQRIDISYQLLLIAQTLTESASNFSLYMTDVTMDNFAVRQDGTVLLIDVESIVIVDSLANNKGQNPKYHHSKGEFCKDCLNFSFEDLCSHYQSDHNYYAICKGLLVPGSYFSKYGFLHSIPKQINSRTNLSHLLEECAHPSNNNGRFKILPKLLQVLKSLL